MWKIIIFFNLKLHKHIALHQIHKIMLFLATSYDPFNPAHRWQQPGVMCSATVSAVSVPFKKIWIKCSESMWGGKNTLLFRSKSRPYYKIRACRDRCPRSYCISQNYMCTCAGECVLVFTIHRYAMGNNKYTNTSTFWPYGDIFLFINLTECMFWKC